MRRFSWLLLSQNAQVKDLHDGIITIGFASSGAAKNFRTSGADEILHQALIDELGVDWRVEGIIEGPGESAGGRVAQAPDPAPAPASPGAAPGDSISPSPTNLQGSRPPTRPDQATDVSDDDAVVEDTTLSSHELLARELGAEVIEDIRDDVSG